MEREIEDLNLHGDALHVGDEIYSVVLKLPLDVQEFVFDEVLFIGANANAAALKLAIRPCLELTELRIVILNPYVFDLLENEAVEDFEAIIAHEIAHHRCNHEYGHSESEYLAHEDEANELMKRWGFNSR